MSVAIAVPAQQSPGWIARLGDLPRRSQTAGVILLVFALVAITGPLWAPYEPTRIGTGRPFALPSLDHLLGTDKLGRDVFSRVVYGSRAVFTLALSATGLAVLAGGLLGVVQPLRGARHQ